MTAPRPRSAALHQERAAERAACRLPVVLDTLRKSEGALASAMERVKELEALLLLRMDGRPEWQAHMEDAEHECDEARAAIRAFIADYEVNGSLPNYALNRLRRVLDSEGT